MPIRYRVAFWQDEQGQTWFRSVNCGPGAPYPLACVYPGSEGECINALTDCEQVCKYRGGVG